MVCAHEWKDLPGGGDYCPHCNFLGKDHLTAIVDAVVDTVLVLTVALQQRVEHQRLRVCFQPPGIHGGDGMGWYMCTLFHRDALVLSWLGRKKVDLGIAEAVAANRIYHTKVWGPKGGYHREYKMRVPDELRARRLLTELRQHGAMV